MNVLPVVYRLVGILERKNIHSLKTITDKLEIFVKVNDYERLGMGEVRFSLFHRKNGCTGLGLST